MARQLVFTSAPQGLTPGRTGYCTVARHGDLRERLVPILESLSVYPSDWQPAPVICAFRLVDVGGTRFPVLSRVVDAGFDYTHRSHYLAHHLILDPAEAQNAPAPAEVFLRWPGWLNHWEGAPRWLDEGDAVNLAALPGAPTPPLPAQAWKSLAGDAGHAVLLLEGALPAHRVLRGWPGRESELLYLFRESAALLPAAERWHAEFTNCLQPAESLTTYRWAGVRTGTSVEAAVTRSGVILDLTRPESLPPVPASATVRLARGEATMPVRTATASPPLPRPAARLSAPVPVEEVLSAAVPSPRARPRTGFNFWILATVGAMILAVLAVLAMLSTISTPPPKLSLPPPAQAVAPLAAPTASAAVANEEALMDLGQLADQGKFLEALARWKDYSETTPDLAQAHIDLLNRRLLPGARQEWLEAIGKISAQLDTGQANLPALTTQLEALHQQAGAWPFSDPEAMTQAEGGLAAKLNCLGQLPDAPVWVVDNLSAAATGPDYEDATAVLAIPELEALLGSAAGKFHVSAAPAASIVLPGSESWYHFQVLDTDFGQHNYLILHDASRGDAGGRFLQLVEEAPGKTRLTWRQFQPNAAIFQRYPANAPLRPVSREMWLHFAGEPPLASFYLLLRRRDNTGIQSWKPLTAPEAWLSVNGAPATVALPPWLGNNLAWHASAGQSFHLEPANLSPAASLLPALDLKSADTPRSAHYPAADLLAKLKEKMSKEQTDLAMAKQQWQDLTTAASGPVDRRPAPGAIDLAAETVKKIQKEFDQTQAAAEATAHANWPATAAPWMLFYTVASKDTLIILQFTPR